MNLDARIDSYAALSSPHLGSLPKVESPAKLADKGVDGAVQMLETYFATLLVKEMRGEASFFGGEGSHDEIYSGWLDQHLGEALGKANMLDLAGQVRASLSRGSETDA